MNNEKTEKELQKEILYKLIKEISKENMDMYYSSHSDMANEIEIAVEENNYLTRKDLDLIRDLKATEISIMLSLNS
jgi:hypothetical protein